MLCAVATAMMPSAAHRVETERFRDGRDRSLGCRASSCTRPASGSSPRIPRRRMRRSGSLPALRGRMRRGPGRRRRSADRPVAVRRGRRRDAAAAGAGGHDVDRRHDDRVVPDDLRRGGRRRRRRSTKHTSSDVPPMSNEITPVEPVASASATIAVTPAAGPDSTADAPRARPVGAAHSRRWTA